MVMGVFVSIAPRYKVVMCLMWPDEAWFPTSVSLHHTQHTDTDAIKHR